MIRVARIEISVASTKLAREFLRKSYRLCRAHNVITLKMTDQVKALFGTRESLSKKNAREILEQFIKETDPDILKRYFQKLTNELQERLLKAMKDLYNDKIAKGKRNEGSEENEHNEDQNNQDKTNNELRSNETENEEKEKEKENEIILTQQQTILTQVPESKKETQNEE